jgi:hypothetical protein
MRPDVAMRTIARLVAYVVLGTLLILLGITGAALAVLWPPCASAPVPVSSTSNGTRRCARDP